MTSVCAGPLQELQRVAKSCLYVAFCIWLQTSVLGFPANSLLDTFPCHCHSLWSLLHTSAPQSAANTRVSHIIGINKGPVCCKKITGPKNKENVWPCHFPGSVRLAPLSFASGWPWNYDGTLTPPAWQLSLTQTLPPPSQSPQLKRSIYNNSRRDVNCPSENSLFHY